MKQLYRVLSLALSSLFFTMVGSLSSTAYAADKITYQVKEFSNTGHFLLGDDGHIALFAIPLHSMNEQLNAEFDIKRLAVSRIDRRVVPGRSLVKFFRYMILESQGYTISDRAHDFFNGLREEQPHTYVIVNNQLIFTESTKSPAFEPGKNRLSKHYIISGQKSAVQFAGEFYVYKNVLKNEVFVVFDNASGTYRPSSDGIANLATILQANFADDGLHIHAKSFDQKVNVEKLFGHAADAFHKDS